MWSLRSLLFFPLTRITLVFCVAAACCDETFAENEVTFNDSVRPILSRHCIACHGPDEGDRQAGLRLDTFAGATEDFGGYSAVDPGKPEESELMIRIESDDPDLRMPPPDHADPLSAEEIGILRTWIEQGGTYQTHWSFLPPQKPPVPEVGFVPGARVQTPIDAFILKRVHEVGLAQNPPADPRVLIRRLSLDLTGLPPGAHDESIQLAIQDYLNSPSQTNLLPYVDGLLHTTAYAEHWAAMWLDIARYADTVGYSGDEKRDIWPWRDWLIRALESEKSYKDLGIEMLAGDLLDHATDQQRLATAFHRNTLVNNEGGTNNEEFRVIAVKDRLSTTLNAWMGLTVRCAECHSHKYDPISQREYYQLLDFFNQTVDSDNRDDRPKLSVLPQLDPQVTAKLNQKIAELEVKLEGQPEVWKVLRPIEMKSRNGTKFKQLDDDSILAGGPNPKIEEYSFSFELPQGTTLNSLRLEALTHVSNDGKVGRSAEGAFILSQIRLELHEGSQRINVPFSDAESDYSQPNQHVKTSIQTEVKSGGKQGWAVRHPVDGYKAPHEAIFQLKEPIQADQETRFTVHLLFDPPWRGLNMSCMRFSIGDDKSAVEKYRRNELDPINREISLLIAKRDVPVRVPVMQELQKEQHRQTHVMIRGNFQSLDERVSAEFPKAFPPADDEITRDRLGLAQWIFDRANPLTARVAVNRYWSRLMGIGIVETEEDFGTQATPPTHPLLLDYLATKFQDNDWDTRWLLKEMVMSATYQQSAVADSDSTRIDPRNRLLSRGPRVRLTAEVVRDQALAVSGLLSPKRYGPPVYPPSPIKRVVNAFTGGMTWQESLGEDRYRRAIYTFLKRSAPHPLFETFDMASREVCSMRRLRTNTPLQSFMTLNDITFIEAARQLAKQMLEVSINQEAKWSATAQPIVAGYQVALYQDPDQVEIETLVNLYQASFERYQLDTVAAAEFFGVPSEPKTIKSLDESGRSKLAQQAAMTVVANVILNLDGFLNN